MASVDFFNWPSQNNGPDPNWGTGRHGKESAGLQRPPTWHVTGMPMDHTYKVTNLHLSNVRDNDELVPRPQSVDISKKCINLPFPAEHPYASHIAKFALIPKFDSPQDPKRGVMARQQRPISDEMPANPYNITVVKKTKGFPYREEILRIPSEGKREALYWQGEHYFDQQSKIHGNTQQYYPIPPKQIAPNFQDRPEELCISEKTQNVLRNIERNQWIPSQKLHYTGLGPANPMVLDNLDCKKAVFLEDGVWDDKLYPHSINTFDPARPLEGYLRKLFAPKSAQQIMIEDQMKDAPDVRKMTAREKAEDELLNGRVYVNLPARGDDPLKNFMCQAVNNSVALEQQQSLYPAKGPESSDGYTGQHKNEKRYLDEMKEKFQKTVQGMEAQNRWRLLESATPNNDIIQLREKYKLLKSKEMPTSYYLHEGQYNEERAGLYKTSYDPHRLAYSMNEQQLSGGVLFNTSMSHMDANLYPTVLWDENESALKGSHTVVFKNSELSGDRPGVTDVLNPYREAVAIQRCILQPNVDTARPRVQEGEFVLRENSYGDHYGTRKFLQERKLDRNIRIEPLDLMSHENQNLERTHETSTPWEAPSLAGKLKSVHFSDDVSVTNMFQNVPVKIEESLIRPLNSAEKGELAKAFDHGQIGSMSYTQTQPEMAQSIGILVGEKRNLAENFMKPVAVPTIVACSRESLPRPESVNFTRDPQLRTAPLSETADKFRTLSVNFVPNATRQQQTQRPGSACLFQGLDYGEKYDSRFNWAPGTGQLKPQSCLMELQDSFVKTEVHKRLHRMFPESNPDIRANFTTGKKKSIFKMQAEAVHG